MLYFSAMNQLSLYAQSMNMNRFMASSNGQRVTSGQRTIPAQGEIPGQTAVQGRKFVQQQTAVQGQKPVQVQKHFQDRKRRSWKRRFFSEIAEFQKRVILILTSARPVKTESIRTVLTTLVFPLKPRQPSARSGQPLRSVRMRQNMWLMRG